MQVEILNDLIADKTMYLHTRLTSQARLLWTVVYAFAASCIGFSRIGLTRVL
jgi:hypothetical protein